MQKKLAGLTAGLVLFGMAGMVDAALTTIGTATYNGSDYKLIWDNDNNGNSVIWLDYSNTQGPWSAQVAWAAGLDAALTYHIDAAYKVAWDDADWRLPVTVDGPYKYGYDGSTTAGYNITSSEMGHLYYDELGNLGYLDPAGNSQAGFGLQHTGDFDNLTDESWWWSGTENAADPVRAWAIYMPHGFQSYLVKSGSGVGLAVRSGQVSAVPVPGAIWLLGSGLTGMAALRRRKKGNRV